MRNGRLQVYCSHVCRQKASIERQRLKIIEQHEKSSQRANSDSESNTRGLAQNTGEMASTTNGFGIDSNSHVSLLEKLYEAKFEYAKASMEVDSLRRELSQKSAELDELESSMEEDDNEYENGLIGSINQVLPTLVKSYKEEPEATMGFLRSAIGEIVSTLSNQFHGKKTKGENAVRSSDRVGA